MVELNPTIPIITLNVNGLNAPCKRQTQFELKSNISSTPFIRNASKGERKDV